MDNTEKIAFLGIDHPAVAADDVEKLADWYCDFLGYEKQHCDWNARPPKPVWILKAPDGTLLEIMPKDETSRQARTTWTPGWSHVAFRVSDLEKTVAILDKKGIEWSSDIIDAIGGGKVRSALDGEGNMIQFLER